MPDIREELLQRNLSRLPQTKIQEPALTPEETEEILSEGKIESMINVLIELLTRANMILDDVLTEGEITDEGILRFLASSKGDVISLIKNLKLLQSNPEEFLSTLQPPIETNVPLRPTMTPEELAATRNLEIPSPEEVIEWQRLKR